MKMDLSSFSLSLSRPFLTEPFFNRNGMGETNVYEGIFGFSNDVFLFSLFLVFFFFFFFDD